MKHWCNNVDWSLESVLLNINNDGGEYFEEGHFLFLEMVGSPSKWVS